MLGAQALVLFNILVATSLKYNSNVIVPFKEHDRACHRVTSVQSQSGLTRTVFGSTGDSGLPPFTFTFTTALPGGAFCNGSSPAET